MNETERYATIDMPYYRAEIEPFLPPAVLDFHAHIWMRDHWLQVPWEENTEGGKYMVTQIEYSPEILLADGARMFPGHVYQAVCFGNPTPSVNLRRSNDFLAGVRKAHPVLFPLMLAGKGLMSGDEIRASLARGFFGYKVMLNWFGDNYGSIQVSDMIGDVELSIADELRLVVLLHVPGSRRLADPAVQEGVRRCATAFPNAQFVLAHCGRCYHPDEMKQAIRSIVDLPNVHLDTSMVMEPTVLEMVFDHIGPRRVLFATDFPVAVMRGRRVYAMDHWVDIVLDEGHMPSDFRLISNKMHATFMAWEIALAIRRAADQCGVKNDEVRAVFHDNGMAILKRVRCAHVGTGDPAL